MYTQAGVRLVFRSLGDQWIAGCAKDQKVSMEKVWRMRVRVMVPIPRASAGRPTYTSPTWMALTPRITGAAIQGTYINKKVKFAKVLKTQKSCYRCFTSG